MSLECDFHFCCVLELVPCEHFSNLCHCSRVELVGLTLMPWARVKNQMIMSQQCYSIVGSGPSRFMAKIEESCLSDAIALCFVSCFYHFWHDHQNRKWRI